MIRKSVYWLSTGTAAVENVNHFINFNYRATCLNLSLFENEKLQLSIFQDFLRKVYLNYLLNKCFPPVLPYDFDRSQSHWLPDIILCVGYPCFTSFSGLYLAHRFSCDSPFCQYEENSVTWGANRGWEYFLNVEKLFYHMLSYV